MQFFLNKFNSMSTKEKVCENKNFYDIYPYCFDTTNSSYLISDKKYIACLIVIDYNKEMEGAFLDRILKEDIDLQISMFYEKQNSSELIKKLTYHIGNTGADIKSSNENQTDAEIMSSTYDDAKYMRKKLQIEGEDRYYLCIYLCIKGNSEEELEKNVQKVEGILNGIGLKTRRAIYRQKQVFDACMPININPIKIKQLAKRNVLSSGIISTYPFLSNELCDENGILFGVNKINKSIVMVDRFDSNKYKNANMCVIGTSGSGKSFFTKLMVARNRYMNISQFVIDPEREYEKICCKLQGSIINFDNNSIVNIMDIREGSREDDNSYLQNKIFKLNVFFSLIFPNITIEEKSLIEEKIIECYKQKNITFDDESLYKTKEKSNLITNKVFKQTEDMPILEDLYKILKKEKRLSRICILLKPYISGCMKFLNGYTNVDLSNKLIVADIYNIEEEYLPAIMYVITELFWDKIRVSRNKKKIIYIDEIWRLISSNEETAKFIFKMFKTIRKYGGAISAITQDINDFFTLENGKYGKGILNNSSIKCVFQLEENDLKVLKENVNLSEEEIYKIQNASRGTCLLYAGQNHMVVKIEASAKEHEYI